MLGPNPDHTWNDLHEALNQRKWQEATALILEFAVNPVLRRQVASLVLIEVATPRQEVQHPHCKFDSHMFYVEHELRVRPPPPDIRTFVGMSSLRAIISSCLILEGIASHWILPHLMSWSFVFEKMVN